MVQADIFLGKLFLNSRVRILVLFAIILIKKLCRTEPLIEGDHV